MPAPRETIDYGHEVKLARSPLMRMGLKVAAFIFLTLGVIGIFLPVLPTTPFLLLASACYARSSLRFYNWLMNDRRLGPPLRRWKERGAISRGNKILAIGVLIASLGPTVIWAVPILAVKVLLAGIGLGVTLFLITRPES